MFLYKVLSNQGLVQDQLFKDLKSLRDFYFVYQKWNVYWRVFIVRNLPCPEKFLLVRL